jgi:hypothetical protein
LVQRCVEAEVCWGKILLRIKEKAGLILKNPQGLQHLLNPVLVVPEIKSRLFEFLN